MSDDDLLPDAPSDAEWPPIRAALREVDVPHDARESALAAALAAFDELHAEAPAAAAAAAPVVHLSARRPRAQRWLTAAAAVVAVLAVGGVVAKRVISPANDNDSNVAVPALDSSLADPARSTAAAEEKTAAADPNAADAEAAAAPEAVATTMAPAVALEAAPEGGGVAPPSTIGSIDGAASTGATTVIDSPESLAAYARSTDSTGRGAVAGSASACVPPGSEALGTVVYLQQEAVVVRNADTGEVSALDRLSCAVLASVTP